MAIVLDVLTRLDERSVALASGAAEAEFLNIGLESGRRMVEGVHSALGQLNMAEAIRAAGSWDEVGQVVGEGLGMAIGESIKVGLVGAFAVGGAMTALALEVGEGFEEINRSIEIHTAASGEALEGLKAHADALVGSLDTSSKRVGDDMGMLAQRLQMEAGPALDQLTRHVETLRDRFGQLDTSQLAAAFLQFRVTGDQADASLASLMNSAREFDVPLQALTQGVSGFSSTLSEANLNFDQSAHLMAALEARMGEGGAQKAIGGLEASMKAAKATGQDFPSFLENLTRSLDYYQRTGQTGAAEELAFGAGGTRKWAELKAAAEEYLRTVQAGPAAFAGQGQQIDEMAERTRNLHNRWLEVKNRIDAALMPAGETVVDEIGRKLDGVINFINGHQEDIRRFFEAGIDAAATLVEDLAKIAGFLGQHPQLIRDVAIAFGTWEAIKAVSTTLTTLEAIGAALRAMPEEAAIAGVGVEAGLAPLVAMAATLAPLLTFLATANQHGSAPGATMTSTPNAAPGQTPGDIAAKHQAGKTYADQHGGRVPDHYQQWLEGKAPMPPDIGPFYHAPPPPPPPGGAPPGPPGAPPGAPPAWLPGPGSAPMVWKPGQGYVPAAPPDGATADTGSLGAPGDPPPGLLSAADLDPKKKGHAGPKGPGPQVPLDPAYAAPPRPGETLEQYRAEGEVAKAHHDTEERRAQLTALEHSNNANADAVQKARNELIEAQRKEQAARLSLTTEENNALTKQLKHLNESANQFGEIGAKLDADFGVSKGLAGIADNLTKFLANIAMAPTFGHLMAEQAATGGGLGVPRGASGMIGMAALGGAFGQQYTPLGLMMSGSYGQGAGGGPGGLGGALGALGAASARSYGGFGGLGAGPGGSGLAALNGLSGGPSGGFGAAAGHPTLPPPDENMVRAWVQQNFGIPNTFGTGSWENAAHDADGAWHHNLTHDKSQPGYAFDFHGTDEQMDALANWVSQNYRDKTLELIHQGPGFDPSGEIKNGQPYNYGPGLNAQHGGGPGGHVHWALTAPPYLMGGGLDPSALQGPTAIPGADMTTDASGAVMSPSGSAGVGGAHRANWDAVHAGEAGSWDANTGNGYYGGLQFTPSSWALAGGTQFAPSANLASPEQQKIAADHLYDIQGPGAWPNTFVPNAPSRASGGPVPIIAHEGEHVFTGADVDAMGGHGNVYDFRRALHYDDGGDVGDQGPTKIGGAEPWAGIGGGIPGGGGSGAASLIGGASPSGGVGGGMPGGTMAAGAAAGAASMGIGLAAQIAMQEAQRAIQFGGQMAGIGVEGLLQTFLPTGGSELAQNNWLTRIGGALVGAKPALPNLAGKAATPVPHGAPAPTAESMFGPLTPAAGAPVHQGTGAAPGPTVHIEHYEAKSTEDHAGRDLARHAVAAAEPPGRR